MQARPRIVLIGGDGGHSGVPRHIGQLCVALAGFADLTVVSDLDRGGYGFTAGLDHVVVPGLRTALNPASIVGAGRKLRAVLAERRPDLVWAHARMAVPLARMVVRGRLMVSTHGVPVGPGWRGLFLGAEMTGLFGRPGQDLVYLTEGDRRALPSVALKRHRVHVLPNCSDLGRFSLPEFANFGPCRLVMLTRHCTQKNLGLAARIFAALPSDTRLEIYGEGTDGRRIRVLFQRVLGEQTMRRVVFGGVTSDVAGVLAGADGLLSTSRYEGLSIAMLEAMEMGLPVFSTGVGGTDLLERVHPLFGLITPDLPASARMITQKIGLYRSAQADWAARIHQAWAAHFHPEPWGERVRGMVRAVLERRP